MISNPEEVNTFLRDFKLKHEFFAIRFIGRSKNLQTLLDLEIDEGDRLKCILSLETKDYYRGPSPDPDFPESGEVWEFGTNVKNTEVYIKIKIGMFNKSVICLSFHKAEFEITYPFK
jgi:hypothetical protein